MTTFAPCRDATASALRLSEILSALSYALDITEGQPEGHSVRTCLIGMRIAQGAALPPAQRGPLFYALLLKDLGCSSNAARLCSLFGADDRGLKRDHRLTDWSSPLPSLAYALRHAVPEASPMARVLRVASIGAREKGAGRAMTQTRCDRGAEIAAAARLHSGHAGGDPGAGRALGWHRGCRSGLKGEAIPLLGRIVGLAQTVEVFASTFGVDGRDGDGRRSGAGRWFDPSLVDGAPLVPGAIDGFWSRVLGARPTRPPVRASSPRSRPRGRRGALDLIAQAFARVIDAKSPYTYRHSERVARSRRGDRAAPAGSAPTSCVTFAARRCCTTSASSASPTGSSTSPAG